MSEVTDMVDNRKEVEEIKRLGRGIELSRCVALFGGLIALILCVMGLIFSLIGKNDEIFLTGSEGCAEAGIGCFVLCISIFVVAVIAVVLTFHWSNKLVSFYSDINRSIENLEKNISSIGHLTAGYRDACARNVVKEYLNVVQKKSQGRDRTGHAVNRTHPWIKNAATTLLVSLSSMILNSPKECTIGEDGWISGVFNLGEVEGSTDCVLEWKLGPNQFLLSVNHTPGNGVRFNNIPL